MRGKYAKMTALLLAICCLLTLAACDSQGDSGKDNPQQNNVNGATYTVTLDPNGGVFADGGTDAITLSVKEGNAIDFAAHMPTYEGNTLYGWYQTDGSPWPGARKVSGDITLKAKWSVTEVVETYALVLTMNGEPVTLEYDNGVYQFTIVSQIYGGYAQRSGKYTVYEEDLLAAAQADDGTQQRLLYTAESNYVDATGTIYAEFYNDGEFGLFYDYTNAGERTKYHMGTGYWIYEGYTAPFENEPLLEDETGMGAPSAHEGWPSVYGDSGEEPTEPGGETSVEEFFSIPGTVAFTADADNSETMKANFCGNGTMAIFMTTYNVNVDANYLWSHTDNGGFVITHNGSTENLAADNGDGTYTLADDYGNTYTIVLEDLLAAVGEPELIYTAPATVSTTMTVAFYADQSFAIHFDLTAMGYEGRFATVGMGQWSYTQEDGLQLAKDGKALALTENGDTVEFTVDDNTYAVTLAEFAGSISE